MKHERIALHDGRDDVTLTTYVLDDSPELLDGRARPAVLILPGGAYMGCSDREAEPVALAFAALGYHAFVLRYSVYGAGGPLDWNVDARAMEPRAHSVFPNPLIDVALAMKHIRSRAAEWLVDADRIAVAGFSAGGHNAGMYGTRWHDALVTEAVDATPDELRPAALIMGYALSDYRLQHARLDAMPPAERAVRELAAVAYFGEIDPAPELLDAASPALHVSAQTPPTFLWHTVADALVPVEHSLRFASACAAHGVPFELHAFEAGQHGLSLATRATASAEPMIDDDAAHWVPLAAAWLAKRFSVELPAAMPWE